FRDGATARGTTSQMQPTKQFGRERYSDISDGAPKALCSRSVGLETAYRPGVCHEYLHTQFRLPRTVRSVSGHSNSIAACIRLGNPAPAPAPRSDWSWVLPAIVGQESGSWD